MVRYLLRRGDGRASTRARRWFVSRFFAAFERGFERLRTAYGALAGAGARAPRASSSRGSAPSSPSRWPRSSRSSGATSSRASTPGSSSSTCAARPARASRRPSSAFADIEDTIRTVIPPKRDRDAARQHRHPVQRLNLSLSEGALDLRRPTAQILIALKEHHAPTADYVRQAARRCSARPIPDTTFFFLAPDISTQVLNFGLAAPIDVQVVGPIGQESATYGVAARIAERVAQIPGAADVHLAQVPEQPELEDRRGPHHGRAGGAHRARRRERPARLAVVERAGRAELTGSTSAACNTWSRCRRRSTRSTRSTRSRPRPSPPAVASSRSSSPTWQPSPAPAAP